MVQGRNGHASVNPCARWFESNLSGKYTGVEPFRSLSWKEMPQRPKGKLNPQQRLFIQEYLVDQNGCRAVSAAGYTQNLASANQRAIKLLKHPVIRREIKLALDARVKKVKFKAAHVLRELARIAQADIAKCFDKEGMLKPIHKIPRDVRRAISSIETVVEYEKVGGKKRAVGYTKKIRFWDKTKALELSGKHMKLFTDKVEASGPDGKPLTTQQLVVVLPAKNR